MKESLIMLILMFVTWASFGQIGSISVNGRKFGASADKVSNFKFELFDTLLTDETIKYLNEFGTLYKDSLHGKQSYLIELTPGLTSEEREVNDQLGTQRLMIVIRYLEKTFGISRSEFKARFSETVTITCDAYLASDKQKRKLKRYLKC